MENVKEIINVINASRKKDNEEKRKYNTRSQKDEIKVMKAMLNDKTYEINVYDSNGIEGTFNPSLSTRNVLSSIISSAAKITEEESTNIMKDYEFNNKEAKGLIDLSKEFINTYLNTGRKISFGGREKSNISISKRIIEEEKSSPYPVLVGKDENGNDIFELAETHIPEYESIKVFGPCPEWVKDKR